MPAGFALEGIDPLKNSETIRILATQFTITSNKPELIERLPYLTQRAEQYLPIKEHCEISVIWEDGEYRISGGGEEDEYELSLPVTFANLFARIHEVGMRHFADYTRIHAASGFGRDGGMVLLVGEKWAGKTTTAVHLLLEGFEFVGDELVLLRHGQGITFPRPFYLRHAALDLLPKLGEMANTTPFVNEIQGKLFAIDPLKMGRSWKIRLAPVRTVVFLESNHGGASSLSACSKTEMVQRVVGQSSPPSSGREDWLADLCKTIDEADTFVARMGNLPSATGLFQRILT